MAGRPRGAKALTEEVKIRLDPDDMATLDTARAGQSRAGYIRSLIRGGKPTQVDAANPERPEPTHHAAVAVQDTVTVVGRTDGPYHPAYVAGADGEPRHVQDTPLPVDAGHRHKPARWDGQRYDKGVLESRAYCSCGLDLGWRRP